MQWRNGNVPKSVMHVHACVSAIKEQKKCWELFAQKFDRFQTLPSNNVNAATPKQHETACANERNMYHPIMLRPFARDLSSEK